MEDTPPSYEQLEARIEELEHQLSGIICKVLAMFALGTLPNSGEAVEDMVDLLHDFTMRVVKANGWD